MTESRSEWLQRSRTSALNGLDRVRGALMGQHVNLELILDDMKSAVRWAVEHWLSRTTGAPLKSAWHTHETRFLRTAPEDLQDPYFSVAAGVTDLAEALLDHIAPGTDEIVIQAPTLADWRDKAGQWVAAAESLMSRLTGPEVAPAVFPGAKRIGRGALRGRLDGLMPCLILTRLGSQYGHRAQGGDTPGLFNFSEIYAVEADGRHGRSWTGQLLPIAFCRDSCLQRKLYAFADLVQPVDDTRQATRKSLQAWLDREGLGTLRLVDRGLSGPWIEFVLSRDLFPRLLQKFDYVTAVRDGPDQPTHILDHQPFPWSSPGEMLDSEAGSMPNAGVLPNALFLATEAVGGGHAFSRHSERSWLFRPNAYWSSVTRPAPDVPTARITVELVQDELSYGWADMTIGFGDQTAVVTLSDVYDPFPSLCEWLQLVAEGDLPIAVTIDEEGDEARLVAHSFDADRLFVAVLDRWTETTRAAAVVERDDFVETFRGVVKRFLIEMNTELWHPADQVDEGEPSYAERLLACPLFGGIK